MKWLCIGILLALACGGCGEEFMAGVGTGAIAAKKLSDDAQDRFIESVNALNKETTELNTKVDAVKDIDPETFIRPETRDAIESLKERGDDPVTWLALASLLTSGFFGGQAYTNRKKVKNE